ncbi:12674_t:CDS:1, partial [Funneliformis geosporum]
EDKDCFMSGHVCARPPPNEGFCVRLNSCFRPDGSTTKCWNGPVSR